MTEVFRSYLINHKYLTTHLLNNKEELFVGVRTTHGTTEELVPDVFAPESYSVKIKCSLLL